jgi:SnoaL-like domain
VPDPDLQRAIEILLEKQAVVEAVTRLFVSTDNRDWKAVEACLAREVLYDMSSLGAGPPARLTARAIVEGWEAGLGPIQDVHHQVGNFLVEIRGARATAFCYGIAFHHLPNPTGRNTRTFIGSYEIGLEKTDGVWRIAAFRFELKYREGNLELESAG